MRLPRCDVQRGACLLVESKKSHAITPAMKAPHKCRGQETERRKNVVCVVEFLALASTCHHMPCHRPKNVMPVVPREFSHFHARPFWAAMPRQMSRKKVTPSQQNPRINDCAVPETRHRDADRPTEENAVGSCSRQCGIHTRPVIKKRKGRSEDKHKRFSIRISDRDQNDQNNTVEGHVT